MVTKSTLIGLKSVLLLGVYLSSSCAGHKYSVDERRNNQSFVLSTNAPNATVMIQGSSGTITKLSWHPLSSDNNGTSGKFTLPSLKKKNLTLLVTAPDYNNEYVYLKRTVRGKALAKSLGLSVFLYGAPLIVDVFRSDFYVLNKSSKSIQVEMSFSNDFYRRKFDEILQSENTLDFSRYVQRFPKSPYISEATRLRDELEFKNALAKGTEKALDVFIISHADSPVRDKAIKAKSQMENARIAFNEAKLLNTEKAYSDFLTNYPFSIHDLEARKGRVKAAYSTLVLPSSSSSEQVIEFTTNYLLPTSDVMEHDWIKNTIDLIIKRFVDATDRELELERLSEVERKSHLLKRIFDFESRFYKAIPISGSEGEFYIIDAVFYKSTIEKWVLNHYYMMGLSDQNPDGFEKAISELVILFPEICHIESHYCLLKIIDNQSHKNGEIIISNPNWVINYFKEMWEGDVIIQFRAFYFNGDEQYLFNHADWMRLRYKNNALEMVEVKKESKTTCLLKFKSDTRSGSIVESAEYFSDGKIVGKAGFFQSIDANNQITNRYYYYEIVNGINKTLNEHPAISNAKSLVSSKFYNTGDRIDELRNARTQMMRLFSIYPASDVKSVPGWEKMISFIDLRISNYESKLEKERKQKEREEKARLALLPFWYGESFTDIRVDYLGSSTRQISFFADGKSGEYSERHRGKVGGDVTYSFDVLSYSSGAITIQFTGSSDTELAQIVYGKTDNLIVKPSTRSIIWGKYTLK
jgi:hypothetical protein